MSRGPSVSRGSLRRVALAENVLVRLLPRRAQRGSTWFGRLGDIAQQPPVWLGVAGLLVATGGARGRRAAARGGVSYGVAAVVANLIIKPVVGRKRPPGSGAGRPGPVTSSFPSGHTATDLAFSLAACQEIPVLFLPFSVATCASHWSLIRSRGHYPTDVLVGGAVGVAAAAVLWVLWPPGGRRTIPSSVTTKLGSAAGSPVEKPAREAQVIAPLRTVR